MKIFSAEQIREADAYTIRMEPVSSIKLMERAAKAFVEQFEKDFTEKKILKIIFCGPGNNGGDGLAIARLLLDRGHKVIVYDLPAEQRSSDHLKNLKRLKQKYPKTIKSKIPEFLNGAIIIDAIFGTGFKNGNKQSGYAEIIKLINSSGSIVVSVDIPSGLVPDAASTGEVVKADKTYTFQFPKMAFLFPSNGKHVGALEILDIGLHPGFIENTKTPFNFTTQNDIPLTKRERFSHKGNYGHALIVSGSFEKIGAAVLCARAALRTGCGLVTAVVPACGYEIMQISFPEAMCIVSPNEKYIDNIPSAEKFDAIAIGPGIGTQDVTMNAFRIFLGSNNKPLVIDADALNILSKHKEMLSLLKENTILTPHPKEFERLAGKWKNDFERLDLQRRFSKKYKVIIVLKGAYSSITDNNGNVYFNSSGNPGMATGGSGDVLTGIIASFLAQQYSPIKSAIYGTYIHGMAGDLALENQSMESLIASDIIENLSKAFKEIHGS